ncbi:MAG: hypothetical protein M3Q36_03070 [bacterium]|nr:hypothetical protein [bacterium]
MLARIRKKELQNFSTLTIVLLTVFGIVQLAFAGLLFLRILAGILIGWPVLNLSAGTLAVLIFLSSIILLFTLSGFRLSRDGMKELKTRGRQAS